MQSYNFIETQKNTIEVSPYFATLVEESEKNYKFEIVFKVLQSSIVLKSLRNVLIKCINSNVFIDKKSNTQILSSAPLQQKHSVKQSGLFEIENILYKHQRQNKLAIAKENRIIARSTVNLQSYVNSNVANLIKSGKNPADIDELYTYSDTLELLDDDYFYSESSTFDQADIKDYNLELISSGIHPANVVFTEEKYPNDIRVNYLRNYYLENSLATLQKEASYYVPVKKKRLADKISIKTFLEIPKNLVSNSFDVHFEIFSYEKNRNCSRFLNQTPVERIVKSINLLKHLKLFKLQSKSPLINYKSDHIEVKQNDKNSNYIKLEKKEISNSGVCTMYTSVYQGYVKPGDSFIFNEPEPDNKFCIFRCSSGDSVSTIVNPLINSLIVGKSIPIDTLSFILTDLKGVTDGVEITVKYPPKFASQFQISKRTWTGSSFNDKKIVIPYQNFDGQSTTVIDLTVKNTEIYEYFLDYKTDTGEVRNSSSQVYQYTKETKNTGGITVNLKAPSITLIDGRATFTINIVSSYDVNQDDQMNSLLGGTQIPQDIIDALKSNNVSVDIADKFYHVVSRLNLKTGERIHFKELSFDFANAASSNTQFLNDDYENNKKFGLPSIDITADYLYEVRTFKKNVLAGLKNYIHKISLPPSSNASQPKIYYYRPFKWRQNYTSESGTIPAMDEKNNLLTRTFIDDHEIGVTASYLLTASSKLLAINSLIAERVDQNKVRISWKLGGSNEEFDHFVVVKEVNKVRRFIGATVGQEMYDVLENYDVGTIIYYVTPVLYDFSIGVSNRSNSLIIDPEDLDFKQQISEI